MPHGLYKSGFEFVADIVPAALGVPAVPGTVAPAGLSAGVPADVSAYQLASAIDV